ncbi:MAG: GNAT family N-acetyltransferase [Anaerolineae bacterium]|jgi:GNAT superfamily N-acetyltransferase
MDNEYRIAYVEEPGQSEWGAIGQGITDYNEQQAGDDSAQQLCFVLRAPDEEIVGGLIGATYWNWFYINLMWIREDLRGQGHGHRLLALAEEEARQRGAKYAHLDTFSFQAPGFYQQHGYQVFGELDDFPPGHQRYFLRKDL